VKLKNVWMVITVVFLASCTGAYQPNMTPVESRNQQVLPVNSPLPSATATPSIVPTATIDYQSTAMIAQQTADEARRVNAVVTAQFEQRIQEQLLLTAEHERRVQEIYSWTVTAAFTTIPLTSTQQAIVNTQIPSKQTQQAAQMTATHEAPQLLIAMEDAKNHKKYGATNYLISMAAMVFVIVLMVTGTYALIRFIQTHPLPSEIEQDDEDSQTVTRVNMYTNNGAHSEMHEIPCSPDQLTEFADRYVNKKATLRINNWEGANTLWTRDYYKPFRKWMEDAGLVVSEVRPDGATRYTPIEPNLSDFLRGWLVNERLPAGYEFYEPAQERAQETHPQAVSGELVMG
jgi:hypothetical protein